LVFKFLLARHVEILPSAAEQAAVTALVNKVKQSLYKIVMAPERFPAVVCEFIPIIITGCSTNTDNSGSFAY
jgi:hypothetical protein